MVNRNFLDPPPIDKGPIGGTKIPKNPMALLVFQLSMDPRDFGIVEELEVRLSFSTETKRPMGREGDLPPRCFSVKDEEDKFLLGFIRHTRNLFQGKGIDGAARGRSGSMAGGRGCRTTRVMDSLLWRKCPGISTLFSVPGKKTDGDPPQGGIFSPLADRYYVPEIPEAGREILLPKEVSRHLQKVLRLSRGACLQLFDGKGIEAKAETLELQRGGLRVQILDRGRGGKAPWREIELAFAVPKSSRLETLLSQATQLGVRSLQPLLFHRSPKSAQIHSIPPRWERLLQAAAGQCGLDKLPLLRPPLSLEDWLQGPLPSKTYIALPPKEGTPIHPLEPSQDSAALLVGPEGGFTAEETQMALEAGLSPLTLAPTVLRIETATTIGLGLLLTAGTEAK
jgi:16S rRNA (uracil1498-N3)-methyltransferase